MKVLRRLSPYIAAGILFLFLLLIGLKVYDEYGIFWDDPIERKSSLIAYSYIDPSVRDKSGATADFRGLEEYQEYRDRYYGTAMQMPMVLLEKHFDFSLPYKMIYLYRHLYVFLVFFISCVCFWRICSELTDNQWMGLAGVIFLLLCPRIFADAFYNIKDIMELSLCVISAYFAIRFLKMEKWRDVFFLSVFSALAVNTRIIGAIVPGVCVLLYLVRLLTEHRIKRGSLKLIAIILFSIGIYIAITPITWQNPLRELIQTLKTFSSFSNYEGPVLFLGTYYKTTDLPWYYLPVWIFATVPLYFTMLVLAGVSVSGRRLFLAVRKKQLKTKEYEYLLVLLIVAIPVIFVILFSPVLYNGWRHFYFLAPFLAAIALIGFSWILKKAVEKKAAAYMGCGVVGAGMLMTAGWMIKEHPHEFIYFNPAVRSYVEGNFEKDYWMISQKELLEKICAREPEGEVKIWCEPGTESSRYFLSDEDQQRITIVSDVREADYVVYIYENSPEQEIFPYQYMFETVEELEVDQITLGRIYQRKYTEVLSQKLSEGKAEIGKIQWRREKQGEEEYLIGEWEEAEDIELIAIPQVSEIWISSDGDSWSEIDKTQDGAFKFSPQKVKLIKFKDENEEYQVRVCQKAGEESLVVSKNGLWTGTASENAQEASLAYDGNVDTRWSSQTEQYKGMYYQVLFDGTYEITEVCLRLGESVWDYPRGLHIYGLDEEGNEKEILFDEVSQESFRFSSVDCGGLRFVIEDTEEGNNSYWGISELEVYTDIRGEDNE